jgi:hypothetical protein
MLKEWEFILKATHIESILGPKQIILLSLNLQYGVTPIMQLAVWSLFFPPNKKKNSTKNGDINFLNI